MFDNNKNDDRRHRGFDWGDVTLMGLAVLIVVAYGTAFYIWGVR